MMIHRSLALLLVFALAGMGCASSTLIRSVPPGAKIYVDGQYRGETPYTQEDTAISGSAKIVVLKKDGYRETEVILRKEEFNANAIPALLSPAGLLWVLGYPPEYVIELEREPAE